ncbi:AAA family ATPase [Natronospirillum operosum]|uniref:AAA family ATPase n=1 Tax=Natronospirillum operosum TaxID=2759953 RepID=A0A4Z0WJN8_9GAMM|nr:AAA family ATPase [Natronospirillum operosum]TGG95743.1 AAA family ATPase [Natronospirillum operosum]
MTLSRFQQLQSYLSSSVIGQEQLIEALLLGLLTDGHVLLEGPPGLAKTRAVKALALGVRGEFQRIQFTPDLLPSDITGAEIFRADQQSFEFQPGPIFANLLLADEINRSPAKVQAALLEGMSERQVSAGRETRALPDLFMVVATQNPLEQEGTYPLPEAQLDRFLLHVRIRHPSPDTERAILRLTRHGDRLQPPPADPLGWPDIQAARTEVAQIHVSASIEDYLVHLADATRRPARYSNELADWLAAGISPRATIGLEQVCRAQAWLEGMDFVTPDLVQRLLPLVYRHRLSLDFRAQAQGVSIDHVIDALLHAVPVS